MTRPAEPIFWTNHAMTPVADLGPPRAPVTTFGAGSMSLDAIGTRFGSDKASGGHGFLDFYERFLGELRHSATSVLELGVNGGEALRMWEEYFPGAKILGTDHRPECVAAAGGRITVAPCEPFDVMRWVELGLRHGPFDVVIDDGTHLWEAQIAAFRTLYPFVRPGGYYILEDLDTSYGGYVELFRGNASRSAADYLHALNDILVGGVSTDPRDVDDSFLRSAASRTEFLAYFRRTALMRRRPA